MTAAPDAAYSLSADAVASALKTDLARGLSPDEAARRLTESGPNALPEAAPPSLLRVFGRQLASPLVYLLLVAAAVALALREISDAVVIAVVVLLNAIIGTFQEGRAERSLSALRRITQQTVRVVRAGREQLLSASELVAGDVVNLAAGDAVSADLRISEASQLRAAEAALTGESLPVDKTAAPVASDAPLAERTSLLFAGTHVSAGRARGIVIATGTRTEIGKIARLAQDAEHGKTPLEARIAAFGRGLSYAALGVFAFIAAVGLLRHVPWSELLMVAISQVVGMIPEGLPVAMTIALALGVTRMAKRGAIVRKLGAVETLGSTSVIASDKTGTLTRNEMTVKRVMLATGRELSVHGTGLSPQGSIEAVGAPLSAEHQAELSALLQCCALCNDADLKHPAQADAAFEGLGDPTEVALIVLALKGGVDVRALREAHPRTGELPFDADRKWMATQHGVGQDTFVALKGAPERVLSLCAPDVRARAAAWAEQLAAQALRVMAVARVKGTLAPGREPGFSGEVALLGLVAQLDPPRDEVAAAVQRCKEAGIRTLMITGDHKATGVAIARALQITAEGREALDGTELSALSDAELSARLSRLDVFARVEPAQKLRIVKAVQRAGAVVAMTGDGVNDAPALIQADVGVAMGRSGTEVAKQAARIVLTDDNFATIVAAVEEGRVVYRNLQKALLLLLSTSVAEVIVLSGALVLGLPPPFAAVQILWNNLVTEGLTTVNLVMEPPEGDEMKEAPIARDEPLLSRPLRARMALMTTTIALLNLLWFGLRLGAGVPFSTVQSETFTLLALCEWFNTLNCRSATRSALHLGAKENPALLLGLGAGVLLQGAVLYTPWLRELFHTEALSFGQVAMLVGVASSVLWVEELRKLSARRRARLRASRTAAQAG